MTTHINTKKLVTISLLTAMAYILTFVFHMLPIPPLLEFLKYDPKDIILVLTGMLFGYMSGLASTAIVCLIEMVTISGTGPIGLLMNFISSAAIVVPTAIIYNRRKSFSGAIIGLVSGVALMTGLMLLWNYLITPLYMGTPRSVIKGMLLPVFLPFNLAKGGINAVLTALMLKPLTSVLTKSGLMPSVSHHNESKKSTAFGIALGLVFVIVTAVYFIIVKF